MPAVPTSLALTLALITGTVKGTVASISQHRATSPPS